MNNNPLFAVSVLEANAQLLVRFAEFARRADPGSGVRFQNEYLVWLCLSNPAGRARVVLAELSGTIVGGMILVPVPMVLNNLPVSAWFVANVLTDPAQRKLGLFSTMISASKEFASTCNGWLVGHPNQAALKGWQRAQMSFQPDLVPRLVWLSWPSRMAREVPIGEWHKGYSDAGVALVASAGASLDIRRSPDFMEWRFIARPDVEYRVLVHETEVGACFFIVRSWRLGMDLLVDAVVPSGARSLGLGFYRPTIVPATETKLGAHLISSVRSLGRIDSKRMRFFVDGARGEADGSLLTLAVSDF